MLSTAFVDNLERFVSSHSSLPPRNAENCNQIVRIGRLSSSQREARAPVVISRASILVYVLAIAAIIVAAVAATAWLSR